MNKYSFIVLLLFSSCSLSLGPTAEQRDRQTVLDAVRKSPHGQEYISRLAEVAKSVKSTKDGLAEIQKEKDKVLWQIKAELLTSGELTEAVATEYNSQSTWMMVLLVFFIILFVLVSKIYVLLSLLVLNPLGLWFHKRGLLKSATAMYFLSNLLKQGDSVLQTNLAIVLHDRGFVESSNRLIAKVLEDRPRFDHAKNLLAIINIERGNLIRGVELLEENIAENPNFPMSYYIVAEYYAWLGAFERAELYIDSLFECLERNGIETANYSILTNLAKALRYNIQEIGTSTNEDIAD